MRWSGCPKRTSSYLLELEEEIIHSVGEPEDAVRRKVSGIEAVKQYLAEKIEQRRAEPADDLITKSLDIEIDGRPVTDEELLNYWQFLVQAGLDSVAGMLGYFFHHLATHPADRRRIVEQPQTIPAAMEEMLRAYSFIVTGRKATRDTEIAGCPVAAGSMVQIVLKMSGRDETFYDDAGRWTSTAGRAVTLLSARARTAAWGRTWRGASCGSRWRSGTGSSLTTGWAKARRSWSSAAAQG